MTPQLLDTLRNALGRTALFCAALVATLGVTESASAQPALRVQYDQRGDFVMIGNSSGYECGNDPVMPIVGDVTCPGGDIDDTSPDVFWQATANGATADGTITPAQARSTAVLSLPSGATVTYARLYWAGYVNNMGADDAVLLDRPGGDLDETVAADDSWTMDVPGEGNSSWYQSTADVTQLVTEHADGAYRLGGISSFDFRGEDTENPVVGWVLVVVYQLDSDPPRNLTIFDGFDLVEDGESAQVTIDGFLVPDAGFDAKLGVVTYEGEFSNEGDALEFNGVALSDAVNQVDNFFNSSRSYLGMPVSVAGDLPQTTGEAHSMSGLDIDVVDVEAQLSSGDTSASIAATSDGDRYILGAFVTSISTFKPDFTESNKTFVDLNGGSVLPGDVLEYTIDTRNTGNDTSINTVLTDALPAGLVYVPESITIVSGENAGPMTDADGDDQAEYDVDTNTIIVRLGVGADGTNGGTVAPGDETAIVFRVTIAPDAPDTIVNQAVITAEGEQGATPSDFPTDGNGEGPGVPPTETPIDRCSDDDDCAPQEPICDDSGASNVCVECVEDADCTLSAEPNCLDGGVCGCEDGAGMCATDTDGDGLSDDDEEELGTDPEDADSDDDGVPDGEEPRPTEDTDGDGLPNALDPDSDNDGLFDGTEMGYGCDGADTDESAGSCRPDADDGATTTDPLDPDTDSGGVSDGSEDSNLNGAIDAGETDPNDVRDDDDVVDTDGDGLSDDVEDTLGSDPEDADSDDDGVPDGDEPNPSHDTDGDGLINVLDPDSDNDGLFDGTEMGRDCRGRGTTASAGHCRPDADGGDTTTDPLNPDTDGGGVSDGAEDFDLDGEVDSGEGDPNDAADDDDIADTDGDGLSDGTEDEIGSDPNDADSDDDGVPDGEEQNPTDDTDGDGLINVLDPDSDNDGLFDGTEMGRDCDGDDTNRGAGRCRADADGGDTTTDPLNWDTDGGGVSDGSEDSNLNGQIDEGEADPNDASDDGDVVDSDGDGLSDDLEDFLESDPDDADSDDDGVPDGREPNPSDDTDGDGLINVLDPDSDDDGLFDGTELGYDCEGEDTDEDADTCIADADGGDTTTSPLLDDTDGGGVSDGEEDANRNGQIDEGETDPNDPSDDGGDIGAGGAGGAGPGGAANSDLPIGASLEGGGCGCRTATGSGGSGWPLALLCGGLGLMAARRRRRA